MADTPQQGNEPSCDSCVNYTTFVADLAARREKVGQEVVDAEQSWRSEDRNIPIRKLNGLRSLETEVELNKMTCTAKGGAAGCAVAAFCRMRLVREAESMMFRDNIDRW